MDVRLLAGALLGWTLGANDSVNAFGLAITTQMVRVYTALGLTAVFVTAGAVLQGLEGIQTYGALGEQTAHTAFIITLVPGMIVLLTTTLGLPVSTTQAVVGAMTGLSLLQGSIHWPVLLKLGTAWMLAPLGALGFSFLLYLTLGHAFARWVSGLSAYETCLKLGFVLVGCYSAYALGANNVANVSGVWVQSGALAPVAGLWFGGLSIALGVLTYSHRVMATVGSRLTELDPFSAFISMLSSALTLHLYAALGIPVSASQAMVGAVIGIGAVKGMHTLRGETVFKILFAWFVVPVLAALLAMGLFRLFS